MKVLILVGPASAIQGWGNIETSKRLKKALEMNRHSAKIISVTDINDLNYVLKNYNYDIVWSSLYRLSNNSKYVGIEEKNYWVADELEKRDIPYVGSGSATMKVLMNKAKTNQILKENLIAVPDQYLITSSSELPLIDFPFIVKPCYESESIGIDESSVVENYSELKKRVEYIFNRFKQAALIEEYLPGDEYTVSVIGNRDNAIFPIKNTITLGAYNKYPVLTIKHKLDNHINFEFPNAQKSDELKTIAKKVVHALNCLDHIRIDIREDRKGQLKVIEVNGIPGLNELKSRTLIIQNMYFPIRNKEEVFNKLIAQIFDSSQERYKELV